MSGIVAAARSTAVERLDRRDAEGHVAALADREHHEERQRQQDRRGQQQAPAADRRSIARGARAPRRDVGAQRIAARQHQRGHHQPGRARQQQRQLPADQRGQPDDQGRRQREAGIAAEGVDRERAAHPPAVDRGREDRVVGRMEHAVAEAGDHHQQQQHRVGGPDADEPDAEAEQREAADQDAARAEAVDEEADRRLGQAGRAVEHREREAELDVADAELAPEQREQGRQDQDVEMAEEMPGADQAHHLEVVTGRAGGGFERGHGGAQSGRSRGGRKAVFRALVSASAHATTARPGAPARPLGEPGPKAQSIVQACFLGFVRSPGVARHLPGR